MNKIFAITAIVLIAVVMGMSAVAPIAPQVYATHGGPDPSQQACDALNDAFPTNFIIPKPIEAILEHC